MKTCLHVVHVVLLAPLLVTAAIAFALGAIFAGIGCVLFEILDRFLGGSLAAEAREDARRDDTLPCLDCTAPRPAEAVKEQL